LSFFCWIIAEAKVLLTIFSFLFQYAILVKKSVANNIVLRCQNKYDLFYHLLMFDYEYFVNIIFLSFLNLFRMYKKGVVAKKHYNAFLSVYIFYLILQ